MIKICIWMDVPSHYQSAFFQALESREDVDLQVCYIKGVSERRAAQGWRSCHAYASYENSAEGISDSKERLALIPDWQERIHVVCAHFCPELIDYMSRNNIRWCHWSEAPGVRLADMLNYHVGLFRLLNPLALKMKRRDGANMERHALAVFGQGDMAGQSFRAMGVSAHKIYNLFYVPEALPELEPAQPVRDFAAGRKVFLSVGALCKRKGVDLLLKAFSRLKTKEWCLVFCGMDKADGAYQKLAQSLGIADQVLFLGAYPIDRIAEVYQASDVFVLPSRFDGWGAVLNEAASLGLPLIGTDLCGGSRHLVKSASNGFRPRAGSVASLHAALAHFTAHPECLESFGKISRNLYFQEFTPARNAERLAESLRKAVDAV